MEIRPLSLVNLIDKYTSVHGIRGNFIYLGEIPNKKHYCVLLSVDTGLSYIYDKTRLKELDENES